MRILVFTERALDDLLTGLRRLHHSASYRTTRWHDADQIEPADLVLVDQTDSRGARIAESYRQQGAIVVWFGPGYRPDLTQIRLDSWDSVPEFPCPHDRAQQQGLRVDRCRLEDGVLYLPGDAQPYGRLEDDADAQQVLDRLAYACWSQYEFSTGAPIRWLLEALSGVWRPTLSSPPRPKPQPDPGPPERDRPERPEPRRRIKRGALADDR